MAAADYYTPASRPSNGLSGPFLAPPGPQRQSSHNTVPHVPSPAYSNTPPYPSPQYRPSQPQYPSAPQYGDDHKPSIQFAPAPRPSHRQSASFSGGQRPPPQSWAQGGPPPYSHGPPQHPPSGPYTPPQYHRNSSSGPPPAAPHMRPYMNANTSDPYLQGGYSSDPEPRHRQHRHHKEKDRKRRISDHSRSTNADGFLGAAGGGLIGDLIFPGLGTVGGALAGWIGGKDYGNHRKERELKREREEERWQRRFNSDDGRDRSHSRDRRRSHDRRRSEY